MGLNTLIQLLCVLVYFIVFSSLSHIVCWVRCGTRLYRFLIFASFLTLAWVNTYCKRVYVVGALKYKVLCYG